jgi:hypothetical protein
MLNIQVLSRYLSKQIEKIRAPSKNPPGNKLNALINKDKLAKRIKDTAIGLEEN